MKMTIKYFTFFLVSFFLSNGLLAQEEDDYYEVDIYNDEYEEVGRVFLLEIGLDVSQPVGTFVDFVNTAGIGISLSAYVQAKPTKSYFWGIDYKYQRFSGESGIYDEQRDGVFYTYDASVSTNLMSLIAKYRYYPAISIWKFEPYLEGGIGYNWWYTYFSRQDVDFPDTYENMFEKSDLSFAYSMGLGVQFQASGNIYVNTKVDYVSGNSSSYHARNNIDNFQNPLDAFNVHKTSTDLIRYHVGVTFGF